MHHFSLDHGDNSKNITSSKPVAIIAITMKETVTTAAMIIATTLIVAMTLAITLTLKITMIVTIPTTETIAIAIATNNCNQHNNSNNVKQ